MIDVGTGIGFTAEEIRTDEPTRAARLKWVVAVDSALPAGRSVNAAVCVAAATAAGVAGLLGPEGVDKAGAVHPGLPWAGCTILGATAEQLARLFDRASASEGVFVADMPSAAQTNRVYDEYLAELAGSAPHAVLHLAVSVVGSRNRIDKFVKELALL